MLGGDAALVLLAFTGRPLGGGVAAERCCCLFKAGHRWVWAPLRPSALLIKHRLKLRRCGC